MKHLHFLSVTPIEHEHKKGTGWEKGYPNHYHTPDYLAKEIGLENYHTPGCFAEKVGLKIGTTLHLLAGTQELICKGCKVPVCKYPYGKEEAPDEN